MKLPASYTAADYEKDIYALWEKSQLFKADPTSSKEHFSMVMPPPNETGAQHIGHALGYAIQDILARHQRLQGKDVLWLPGTDHAALATNALMEESLRKRGLTKHQIGRQAFLKETREFVAANRQGMNEQIKALGASVDWSRLRYTLSPSANRIVNEVFVKMYNDGLIYRGYRLVNWDPKLETNVADDEVEYISQTDRLYTLAFGPLAITTVRPETKFGDKYVVMHPQDKRYAAYHEGDQFEAEWINGPITATVIKDEAIDPNFGTGVMTITPWHSQVDLEIADRHHLDKEQIIDLKGRIMPIGQDLAGLTIAEARPKIIEKLTKKGLVIDVQDNYVHKVALNSRGQGLIEPQIRQQWFIDVNKPALNWRGSQLSFKEVMQSVIREGDIKIIPGSFDKLYFHWIDNLRDWCISRQIWWGHQIPVWYGVGDGDKKETYVGVQPPPDEENWQRDPDTLDTWFSSALWTFSTLIDPKLTTNYRLSLDQLLSNSPDFLTYHPTSVLDTASDILFFWVARMILLTTYVTKQVPFKTVYLHGLVLNASGGKMSKSKPETMIDPLKIIREYGSDALRLALIQGMSAGQSQKLSKSKIISNRNFCNKLWNVARYVEGQGPDRQLPAACSLADHWILSRLITTKKQLNADLDNYRFAEAYNRLYHFLWDDLADWYIEANKIEPNPALLRYVLRQTLLVAHPLAPYVTEAIWRSQEEGRGSILAGQVYDKVLNHDAAAAKDFERLKSLISESRSILKSLNLKSITMTYLADGLIDKNRTLIKRLASLSEVKPIKEGRGLKLVVSDLDVWLDVDHSKAQAYLSKLEIKAKNQEEHIKRLKLRLNNAHYLESAPKEVVDQSKQEFKLSKAQLAAIKKEISLFKNL